MCKHAFLVSGDRVVTTSCCRRNFHLTCLLDVAVCPYCCEAWGGLPCAFCRQPTVRCHDRELFASHASGKNNRLLCCGVDVHPKCCRRIGVCPEYCDGIIRRKRGFMDFVASREECLRNEFKRRKWMPHRL